MPLSRQPSTRARSKPRFSEAPRERSCRKRTGRAQGTLPSWRGDGHTGQRRRAAVAAGSLAELACEHEVIVTHGNGAQISMLALQNEATTVAPRYPLDVLGAETEGMIGYLLERELWNFLPERTLVHLGNHDVAMIAVSRYPIEELTAFKKRMGWGFPYVSSLGSEFNFDFGVAYTDTEMANGAAHNMHLTWDHSATPASEFPAYAGLPCANDMPPKDAVGMSAFAREDGVVYHTYSAYARGMDALWGMYQWLDRAPKGRNESDRWYRLHDEYGTD